MAKNDDERDERDENDEHTSAGATRRLNLRGGSDEERHRVMALNLGGSSGNAGAPVIISHGLEPRYRDDHFAHEEALRQNPPAAQIPAQDPHASKEAREGKVPVGTGRQYPGQGGVGSVRRVDDRTPESALESSGRPYNLDTSAAQVSQLTGRDTTEETAEGKESEGGVRQKVKEDAERVANERAERKEDAARARRNG